MIKFQIRLGSGTWLKFTPPWPSLSGSAIWSNFMMGFDSQKLSVQNDWLWEVVRQTIGRIPYLFPWSFRSQAGLLASFDWFYCVIYPSRVFLCSSGVTLWCLNYVHCTSGNWVSTPKVLRLVYLPSAEAKYPQIFTKIIYIWSTVHCKTDKKKF